MELLIKGFITLEHELIISLSEMEKVWGWQNPITTSSRCQLETTTLGKLANGEGPRRQVE